MERAQLSTARSKLTVAREEKGFSQSQLASLLQVDRVTVQRWEQGKTTPQPYHLNELCKILGKTVLELGLIDEHLVISQVSVEETDEIQDDYSRFLASNLPLRLWHSVCNWSVSARYQELQMSIISELEDNTAMNPNESITRRDALHLLASLPVEFLGLSAFQPVFHRSTDEILIHCTAGITACWYLRKGKNLQFVSDTVSKYLPTLKAITKQGTTKQQKAAADLLAQGLLLKAHLAKHLTSTNDAIRYTQQAEKYSEQAENPLLQIAVFRMQDAEYGYANHWGQALESAEKAHLLLKPTKGKSIPPIVSSWVYSSLAVDQAYHEKKDDALSSLKKAHNTFFAQSPDEPVPVWIRHSMGCLVLNDGLTHQYLSMNENALNSFKQVADTHASSEVMRIEAIIHLSLTEASRDDKPRDMDKCLALWMQGIEGAKALHSEEWFNESLHTYKAICTAWPHEKEVKDLRQYLVRGK